MKKTKKRNTQKIIFFFVMTRQDKNTRKLCTKKLGKFSRGRWCICTEENEENYELKAPCAKSFSILRLFPFADVNLASGWRILAKSTGGHRQPSIDVRIVGFVFCKCKCKKILLAILKIRDILKQNLFKKKGNFSRQFPKKG